IGTDATGESPLGNDPTGYFDDVDVFDSSYTTIGGASTVDAYGNLSGLGNLTASNVGVEITDALTDFSTYGGTPSVDNVVQGNFIGTNVNGTTPLGVGNGVILLAVGSDQTLTGNTIGGLSAGLGNLISGGYVLAGTPKVVIFGSGAANNVVE